MSTFVSKSMATGISSNEAHFAETAKVCFNRNSNSSHHPQSIVTPNHG